jgi:prolyl 4-hydroxylase
MPSGQDGPIKGTSKLWVSLSTVKKTLFVFACPCLLAWYFHSLYSNASENALNRSTDNKFRIGESASPARSSASDLCRRSIIQSLGIEAGEFGEKEMESFENVSIALHLNGESKHCGETSLIKLIETLYQAANEMDQCSFIFDKYVVEAVLSRAFQNLVGQTCYSSEKDRTEEDGLYGFCDMGTNKTPILSDHDELVSIAYGGVKYLPCHFHTRQGRRVQGVQDLVSGLTDEAPCPDALCLHLYAVQAGRHFVFAPGAVGEIIELPHVMGGNPEQPVYLRTLSLSPRVFDIVNFFRLEESQDLVARVLKEERELWRLKRSTTGPDSSNVNKRRTSESGFDTSSESALKLKMRGFQALGFDDYIETYADGLQMLRYNLTTAYNAHHDFYGDISAVTGHHNFNSAGVGADRFATILLYMTEHGERGGGETVFTEAWPTELAPGKRVELPDAIESLRASGDASMLKTGSWEETLVAKCRSRLAVQPHPGRAVLFYSQLPNGKPDYTSLHGGCPVLAGQKYAANLWVWNSHRHGYSEAPIHP